MIYYFKKYGDAWVGEEDLYQVAARASNNGWRWVASYQGKIIRRGAGVRHVTIALDYAVNAVNDHNKDNVK